MPFGQIEARTVRNPLFEPLWIGRRTIVRVGGVGGGRARLTDEEGDDLAAFDDLRAALVPAVLAGDAVIDGYLVPTPRDTTGVAALVEGEEVTPGGVGRQLLLGGAGKRSVRRDALDATVARRNVAIAPDGAAFVAIDLLELDGTSLLDVPLLERKRLLESVLVQSVLVRLTPFVRPPVEVWFAQWRALGFLEYAAKAANGRYTPGVAGADWAIGRIPRR
jgi:hypothetical protein